MGFFFSGLFPDLEINNFTQFYDFPRFRNPVTRSKEMASSYVEGMGSCQKGRGYRDDPPGSISPPPPPWTYPLKKSMKND